MGINIHSPTLDALGIVVSLSCLRLTACYPPEAILILHNCLSEIYGEYLLGNR